MKKLLALVVVIAVLVGSIGIFAGCMPTELGEIAPIAKEDLKIGVIHIGEPSHGGYTKAHDDGIVAMQQSLGLKESQIVRKNNVNDSDNAAIKTAIEECIGEGCNMIFATSFGYMNACDDLSKEYPDVIFSHGTGFKSNGRNFNNYFGRIYQARYLSGIAAGLKTVTNKIGYVSAYGTELAETCSGINAFAMGVESVNPEAEIQVKVLNSWYDPANETAYAEALIQNGCDVIAQHCDTPNPQEAAEKEGVFGIGYNTDMSQGTPNATITSTVWDWGVYYKEAVQAAIDGSFSELGNYYAGLKEGMVGVVDVNQAVAVAGTQEKINKVKALIISGEWDVFSGVALSFDAQGEIVKTNRALSIKQNAGENVEVLAGGASVADYVITGTMSWYYTNVTQI